MTAAEYEADINRFLTGVYSVPDWAVGRWRVRRVDRSLPNRSTFYASRPTSNGAIRVQGPDVATVAGLMATWEAAEAQEDAA